MKTQRGLTSAAAPLAFNYPPMTRVVKVMAVFTFFFFFPHLFWIRQFFFSSFLSDVNECESNPCSQECANVYGSYQCYCHRGYQLSDGDGKTCEGAALSHEAKLTRSCRVRGSAEWFGGGAGCAFTHPLPRSIAIYVNEPPRVYHQISTSVRCLTVAKCAPTAA